jgi:ABC-type cobalamin transport system permease subunit
MWTTSRNALGLLVGILGFLLFAGGVIYGFVALTQLSEQRETTTGCRISGTETICTRQAEGRPNRLVEAKQARVILASGLMVSGAVLLGAGVVAGRPQSVYSPVQSPSGAVPVGPFVDPRQPGFARHPQA